MKTLSRALVIIFALTFSTIGHTEGFAWRKNGKPMEDTDSQKSRGGFGALLLLIGDKQFFEDWEKPAPPHFKAITTAKRMIPVYAPVIFAGAGQNDNGVTDVTCDVTIRKPDGSVYGEQKGLKVWKDKIKDSSRDLQLSLEYMAVRIEPQDPAGTYTVEAKVKDNIKKIELSLKQKFTVEK